MSQIILKSKAEIRKMWKANQVVAAVFDAAPDFIKAGISTKDIADMAQTIIESHGAYPTCLGYGEPPFPGAICVSVNNEIVHGIPKKEHILQEGDLVTLDVCATLDGYCGDAARTYAVGKISEADKKLVETTELAFWAGVAEAKIGNRLGDISHAVEQVALAANYGVVRELCGHGIGRDLHEDPCLLNYGLPGKGVRLVNGMVLACEPMFTAGRRYISVMPDEWTIVTADGKKSAHYENTFAITDRGLLILSLREAERKARNLPDISLLD